MILHKISCFFYLDCYAFLVKVCILHQLQLQCSPYQKIKGLLECFIAYPPPLHESICFANYFPFKFSVSNLLHCFNVLLSAFTELKILSTAHSFINVFESTSMDLTRSINQFATENARSCSKINPFNFSSVEATYKAQFNLICQKL